LLWEVAVLDVVPAVGAVVAADTVGSVFETSDGPCVRCTWDPDLVLGLVTRFDVCERA
jgi:hypothetical protein